MLLRRLMDCRFAAKRLPDLADMCMAVSCEVHKRPMDVAGPDADSPSKQCSSNVAVLLEGGSCGPSKKRESPTPGWNILSSGLARRVLETKSGEGIRELNSLASVVALLEKDSADRCGRAVQESVILAVESLGRMEIESLRGKTGDPRPLVEAVVADVGRSLRAELESGITALIARRPVPAPVVEEEEETVDEGKKKKKAKKKKVKKLNVGKGVLALLNKFENDKAGWNEWMDLNSKKGRDQVRELFAELNIGRKPKLAKGTRDFGGEQTCVRDRVFNQIREVFKRHGGVGLDTPVFELRDTLTGKYGEDSKLIYDLADQGGELLSLRYDLTVPFARYLAMNSVGNIKRYHIAKVYRRDNISVQKGRFREFYQCDFDIAGAYDPMMADSEVLKILSEILLTLRINDFQIKVSDRRLLGGMLAVCGVPDADFKPICSAIDKLDKQPWGEVREEMLAKGLDGAVADRIEPYLHLQGAPMELLAKLKSDDNLMSHPDVPSTLEELEKLFSYLREMNVLDYVSFDLSLARGLNYYTGLIYEAVLTNPKYKVGSIAAGGRYDNLVGIFCNKQIPAVGVSIGIERIYQIVMDMELEENGGKLRSNETAVLVASVGPNLSHERFKLLSELWSAGIAAETTFSETPTVKRQISNAVTQSIPYMVIIGEDELRDGVVNLKDIVNSEQETVPRSMLVEKLLGHLGGVAK